MKLQKLLLFPALIVAAQYAFAQNNTHFKLSDEYPSAGGKLTFIYDPSATVVYGKKDISMVVYYLDDKDYPAVDIPLKKEGALLRGELLIPADTKAFFIKVAGDKLIDNNNDKNYIYLIYKNKQPVEGAYATAAGLITITTGMGTLEKLHAKINFNNDEGLALYKKEFALYPQNKEKYQENYYSLAAKNPVLRAETDQKIEALKKSSAEKDLVEAADLLKLEKRTGSSDSLNNIIRSQFPNGILVQREMATAITREKSAVKKDSLFREFSKKYPGYAESENDDLRLKVANAYLAEHAMNNYYKYENMVSNKAGIAMGINNAVYDWADKGLYLSDAEKLAKLAVDIEQEQLDTHNSVPFNSTSQQEKTALRDLNYCRDTYAVILFKENRSAEALAYEQRVVNSTNSVSGDVYQHYVQILNSNGQYQNALNAAATAIKAGEHTDILVQEQKKAYAKVKGTENGYDAYLASLIDESKEEARGSIANTIINKPAPLFSLKDLDGRTISLKDLRGKVVILDFWATWCGPCKASFPAMQVVINKYKGDPNVVFLFVDVSETADNYLSLVKKFIADNKYSFHVVLDEKNTYGKMAKTMDAYKVDGIPTKFVIDKEGNIRFKYVGYAGTAEKVLDEVNTMVGIVTNKAFDEKVNR